MKISYGKKAAVVFVLSVLLAVAYVQSGRSARAEENPDRQRQEIMAQREEKADEGSSVYGR